MKTEYDTTLKRAILRVGDNSPAAQYLAESAFEMIEKWVNAELEALARDLRQVAEFYSADPEFERAISMVRTNQLKVLKEKGVKIS